MKRKIVTLIVAAMMMTSITACGTTNSASAKESVPDTEESVVIDTETEEIETEEQTELVEETEEIQATETAETENTEETQVTSTDKKTQDATKNNASPKATNNDSKTATNNATSTKSASNASAGVTNTNTTTSTGTSNTTAQNTSTTSEHEHVWVEHLATGHYEEQVVTPAYDEPVYEYRDVCNKCGYVFPLDVSEEEFFLHLQDQCNSAYHNEKVQVGTTHHDAETQSVWVEDAAGWYECSICGERDIRASHNHN